MSSQQRVATLSIFSWHFQIPSKRVSNHTNSKIQMINYNFNLPHDEFSQKFKKGKRRGSDNETKPNQYVALELGFRTQTTRRPTQFRAI